MIRMSITRLLRKMYQYFITSLLLTSLWKAARSRIRMSRKTRRCVLMRFLVGASVIVGYSILVSHEPNPTIMRKYSGTCTLSMIGRKCNMNSIRAILSRACIAVFKEPKEGTSCRWNHRYRTFNVMSHSWKSGIHGISMFMLVCSEAQPDLPNQQDFFVLPLNWTVLG